MLFRLACRSFPWKHNNNVVSFGLNVLLQQGRCSARAALSHVRFAARPYGGAGNEAHQRCYNEISVHRRLFEMLSNPPPYRGH